MRKAVTYEAQTARSNGKDEALVLLRGDGLNGVGGAALYLFPPNGISWCAWHAGDTDDGYSSDARFRLVIIAPPNARLGNYVGA